MHPFTASRRPFLPEKIKYISSMTLDTDMILSSIAPQGMSGRKDDALATQVIVLVSGNVLERPRLFSLTPRPGHRADYAPNSCTRRYENLFEMKY
jgi:hypothetical protein